MRRVLRLPYTAALLFLTTSTCVAQLDAGRGNLLQRTQWIRFDIISGRITAHRVQPKDRKTASLDRPEIGLKETLYVANEQSGPVVRFERIDSREQLTIEVSAGTKVEIRRAPRERQFGSHVDFAQAADGSARLTVRQGENRKVVRAGSFWHLATAEKQLCRDHLIPALECCRADWCLLQQTDAFEQNLVQLTQQQRAPTPQRFWTLVRRLGSDEFHRRQEADQEIREMGPVVLSYLNQLDRQTLSAEQRFRVRCFRKSLESCQVDTPSRAAVRLVGDVAIWLNMLAKNNESMRQTASAHLREICQKKLDFNPQAERHERTAQIQRIHDQLGLR